MSDPARILFLALPLLLAPAGLAQGRTFIVDPAASKVTFALQATLHQVKGTFQVRRGTIRFDPTAPGMSGEVVVAAGSGDSGNPGRDRTMNAKVLETAQFSEVSFVPGTCQGVIAPAGDSTLQVTGVFTLLGAPHDLTVPMRVHQEGERITARTRFRIPYVQWGLKDPSVFLLRVAKEVELEVTLQGRVVPDPVTVSGRP